VDKIEREYQGGKIRIVPIEEWHVARVIEKLRESDRKEAWKAWRLRADEVARLSVESSEEGFTILHEGEPTGLFGVSRASLFSETGIIWLLGTDGLEKIGYSLAKETRAVVDTLLEKYKKLMNWVDKKNCKSVLWLKRSGFEVEEAAPFGVYGEDFCYFWKEKRPSLKAGSSIKEEIK